MSGHEQLAHAFIRLHAQGAARLLESLPPAESSAVLATVDTESAAPVLGRMLPTYAALCVAQRSPVETARLLERLGSQEAVAILRAVDGKHREGVLAALGTQWLVAFKLLLNYPVGTIGAWIEPRVLTLPDDCTAGDARERVAHSAQATQTRIYVLDRARRLRGAVPGVALLQTPSRKALGAILEPAEALWAREPLAKAQEHELWERNAEAPVVNRYEEFIGAISYADLRRALRQLTHSDEPREHELAEVTELIAVGAGSLWQSLGELVRSDRRR